MADVPGSPEWWLRRLYAQIVDRRPHLRRLHEYYDGQHPLAFSSRKFQETFGGLFQAFSDNWCGLVIDAVEERLQVVGFRVDPDVDTADDDAWRIWQENQLDAQSQLAHTEALIGGEAYAVVWVGDDPRTPEVTVESPTNVAVAVHPKFRRRRQAALRVWMDEWGFEHAELFLPDMVHLFRSPNPRGDVLMQPELSEWVADTALLPSAPDGTMPNPFGVVPVVPLPNNPRLGTAGGFQTVRGSEIAQIIPLQDGVNKLVADMLVASESTSMPYRYAIGYEMDVDPVTNQILAPAFTKPEARWAVLEETGAQIGQLMAGDLGNFVKAIEMVVQHIASISRTPPHYLNASADRLSGESIKAAETGLVAKVHRKQRHFGEAWEEVMRLTGKVAGLDRLAAATRAEVIWGEAESRSEAEVVDAAMKKLTIGVPKRQLWEDVGYSPQQIARFESAAIMEAFAQPGAATPVEATPVDTEDDPAALKAKADALGVLIRTGVSPESAAEQVGLVGLEFTGAVPVSLRLPEGDASGLEGT